MSQKEPTEKKNSRMPNDRRYLRLAESYRELNSEPARADFVAALIGELQQAETALQEADELLRWAVTYLIPGEGKDELIRAIDRHLGITGRVTDRKSAG